MRFRTVFLFLACAVLTGCTGKIIVTRVPTIGTPPPMEGVYYALPKTVLKVDQPIDKISPQPGKYFVYLPLFFPKIAESGSFIQAAKVTFKVNKASISTYGEPDPTQIFYVKITENGPIDRTGLFEYTEQGTVSGASAQADNVTTDIVLSVLNTVAGLAAKSFGAETLDEADEKVKACKAKSIPQKILKFMVSPGAAFDTERLVATYCRLDAKAQDVLDTAAANKKTDFDDALSAYAQIFTMQTDRATVRKTPQSFSVDAALKDFDASIAAALGENFIGTEKKDTWTFSTDLRDYQLDTPLPLMKVHESEGLCFLNDLPAGDRPPKPFWFESASYLCDEGKIRAALQKQLDEIKIKKPESEACARLEKKLKELAETLQKAQLFAANFTLNPARGQQFQLLASADQSGDRGFFYRIPAAVDVTLSLGDDTVTKSKQTIAQFGTIASLPASTGGKTTAYTLKFYEATGALKSFNVTSKSVFQKATADALGADVNTLVTAKQAAAEAKKTKEDELTVLERQSKIMAAKKAIYDNCKALNMACGGFVPTQATP
jgi:hypothetical protein